MTLSKIYVLQKVILTFFDLIVINKPSLTCIFTESNPIGTREYTSKFWSGVRALQSKLLLVEIKALYKTGQLVSYTYIKYY